MFADVLRESILKDAIHGKLVSQNPTDESANELMKKFISSKQNGRNKKQLKEKSSSTIINRNGSWFEVFDVNDENCIDNEIPFNIPETWGWARLEHICEIIVDCPHSTPKYVEYDTGYCALDTNCFDKSGIISKFRFLQQSEYETRISRLTPQQGDVIFSREGVVGYAAIIPPNRKICLGQRVMLFRPSSIITSDYLRMILSHPVIVNILLSKTKGTGVKHVNVKDVIHQIIPIPPLDEQKRIMCVLIEIDKQISLFKENELSYVHYLNSFPKQLKDSIIDRAIKGGYSIHDSSDESVKQLLNEIKAKKQALVKEGVIKKEKSFSEIFLRDGCWYETIDGGDSICIDDEIPFEIPESWTWCRVSSVCSYINRGKSPVYSSEKVIPVFAQKCNQIDGLHLEKCHFLDPVIFKKYDPIQYLQDGDVLINSTGIGTLGRVGIYDSSLNPFKHIVADSHVTVLRPLIDSRYVYCFFNSPMFQLVAEDLSSGSTKQKELKTDTIRRLLIPIPPMEEQKRIVSFIEETISVLGELNSLNGDLWK